MSSPMDCFGAGWLRLYALLVPVGPPLGLSDRDERAWQELVQELP